MATLFVGLPALGAESFHEGFDGTLTSFGVAVKNNPYIEIVKSDGIAGTSAAKVSYVGFERGSKRVVFNYRLRQPSLVYHLSFSVKFCNGFDFRKGGKLHGLGSKNPVTGGAEVGPLGWSARLMFTRKGGLMTYLYHQDMHGRFGDHVVAKDFRFEPGRYYKLDSYLLLNDPHDASNGSFKVFVDDVMMIDHSNVRFRRLAGEEGEIATVMFSTFHGGSSPDWAPRTATGDYKVDCAFFDQFSLQ